MSNTLPRLKSLFRQLESSASPILAFDPYRRLTFVNAAAQSWVGNDCASCLGVVFPFGGSPPISLESSALTKLAQTSPPPETFQGKPATLKLVPEAGHADAPPVWAQFLPVACGDEWTVIVVLRSFPAEDAASSDALRWHVELTRFRQQQAAQATFATWVGTSPGMQRVLRQATLAARTGSSAYLWGPLGCRALELAREIHYRRTQGHAPGVVVAGDAHEESHWQLAIKTLTTAPADCPGTLFIVAADCVSSVAQVQLAQQLKELPFPVLAVGERSVRELAAAGYSSELLAFFGCLEIELPPLSKRKEDLPLLAQALVEFGNRDAEKQCSGLAASALDKLMLYDWSGDVEQFAAVIAAAHVAAKGTVITEADLGAVFCDAAEASARKPPAAEPIDLDALLREVETEAIQRALALARGNKTVAARLLGLSRPRLYRRMVQLSLIEAPVGWPLSIDEDSSAEEPPE